MRLINYIFRGIMYTILSAIFGTICYVATVVAMFLSNWDLEYASLKTIHNDIAELWINGTFDRRDA